MSRAGVARSLAGAAGLIAGITLLARAAGFARILVFADSVGAAGVGSVYQSVNTIPNVMVEVAAGGVLAAVAVPLIGTKLGKGDRAGADRLANVLLTWALAVLIPVALIVLIAAAPISAWLVGDQDPGAQAAGAWMLRVFALQIPLYGVGIVLTGLVQAHRRFVTAALVPLLSSLVVMASYAWYATLSGGVSSPDEVPGSALSVLAWGTTAGVAVLSLPLIAPALATGWRWRPAWRLERETTSRVRSLGTAGLLALIAQQGATLAIIWLANHAGAGGVPTVYFYAQTIYLLPYAIFAVPIATSLLPALAHEHGAGGGTGATLAIGIRSIILLTATGCAGLIAARGPIGALFTDLDLTAGGGGPGAAALAALPDTLLGFAPGLVGFGLTALLTRALYVRGRPSLAGAAMALGWTIAGLAPLAVVGTGAGAASTLTAIGWSSSVGMSLAALTLVAGVRAAWGSGALAGVARTAATALVAVLAAAGLGSLLAGLPSIDGSLAAVAVGLGCALVAALVAVAVFALGDRTLLSDVRHARTPGATA